MWLLHLVELLMMLLNQLLLLLLLLLVVEVLRSPYRFRRIRSFHKQPPQQRRGIGAHCTLRFALGGFRR